MLDRAACDRLTEKIRRVIASVGLGGKLAGGGLRHGTTTWVVGDAPEDGSVWEIILTADRQGTSPRVLVGISFYAMSSEGIGGSGFVGSRSFPSVDEIDDTWLEELFRAAWADIQQAG